MSLPIAINTRFQGKRVTGVQRYAEEILLRLPADVTHLAPGRPLDGVAGHAWEQTILVAKSHGKVLWSPSNTGPLAVRRQVLTVHDTGFVDTAECFNPKFAAWYQWLIPKLVRRVRRVITISEFSRQRLAAVAKVDPSTFTVIPNGVSAAFRPCPPDAIAAVKAKYGIDQPYVFTLGSIKPNKNLATLVQAWERACGKINDGILVIAGEASLSIFGRTGLADRLSSRVKFIGYAADADLPALLSGCTLFVFPSIYEGFGLPAVEAMACGAPVLSSNSTALPEVLGDAALFVDPRDAAAMADEIVRVWFDRTLQAHLSQRGRARAGRFTWENAAEKTLAVLHEVGAEG